MTVAANPHRGEISVTLDGVEYVLRPTAQAMVSIEERLNIGILALIARAYEKRDIRLTDIAVIIAEGIRAQGREIDDKMMANVSTDKIKDLVFAEGMMSMLPAVQDFLVIGAVGSKNAGNGESGAADAA